MKLVNARVDALVLGFRVLLDERFVQELRAARELAARHGRAGLVWQAPPDLAAAAWTAPPDLVAAGASGAGAVWRHLAENKPIVGQLGRSAKRGEYLIDRKGIYRFQIVEHGPGGYRSVLDETGEFEIPGWTVEIVFYAEAIAEWGLERCLAEAAAMAWQMGRVYEWALRRIDVCVDVAGWEIHPDDAVALLKRSRASFDVATDASEIEELGRRKPAPDAADARGVTSHEYGTPGKRRVCGLSVGYGGNVVGRIYNKVLELGIAGREHKRAMEHARWKENGWDGEAPVTRVEFQIRGGAIKELGLRDPEAIRETVVDEKGKPRGQRVMRREDGRPVTLTERLPWVWMTMLRWMRLVVPDPAQRHACRLETQWRWTFLELVTFGETVPVKRCRVRGVASEAMALGVALSQAARAGELDDLAIGEDAWSREPHAYARTTAEATLRERVSLLIRLQIPRIIKSLLERANGCAIEANVHFANRVFAAWARHADWDAFEKAEARARARARPPPPAESPPPDVPAPPPSGVRGTKEDPFAHWGASGNLFASVT